VTETKVDNYLQKKKKILCSFLYHKNTSLSLCACVCVRVHAINCVKGWNPHHNIEVTNKLTITKEITLWTNKGLLLHIGYYILVSSYYSSYTITPIKLLFLRLNLQLKVNHRFIHFWEGTQSTNPEAQSIFSINL
jgi:hypothetical protein